MMPTEISQHLEGIVDSGLCTGCGTCVGVCPSKALSVGTTREGTYFPQFAADKCAECCLCIEVCPANSSGAKELNRSIFGRLPQSEFLGHFIECYKGYSTAPSIRWSATSGGLITSLLLFLLEKGLIDGALLTRVRRDSPLEAEPFVARTREQVLSAVGSKYVPVPLNRLLREVLAEDARFAVVGLPCHMQGCRKAELIIPELRAKIAYHFGLTCSHVLSRPGVVFILHKMGVSASEVAGLRYRGNGWPSGIRATLRSGEEEFLSNQNSWWSEVFGGYFFAPYYCTLCYDQLNEFADLSFADAWLPETMKRDKSGTSIAISRTRKGDELLEEARSSGAIELSSLSPRDAVHSQMWPLFFKKRNIKSRVWILKSLGKSVPPGLEESLPSSPKPTLLDYVAAPIPYVSILVSRSQRLTQLLEKLPFRVISTYRQILRRMLLHDSASEVNKQSREDSLAVVGKRVRILITNSHANNRGDEAAQRSMIASIRKLVPNAEFAVMTISPDGLDLQEDVRKIRTFCASKKTGPLIVLWTIFRSLGIRLPTLGLRPAVIEAIEVMANADVVISAPGGPYFGDIYASHEIQEHLFHIGLSKILGKPVMVYGPSMGPFRSRWRNKVRKYVLNRVEIITLRDSISRDYLRELELSHPLVRVTGDSAFQDAVDLDTDKVQAVMSAEGIAAPGDDRSGRQFLVGVTPAGARWNFRESSDPQACQEQYNHTIAKAVDYLIATYGATVVFIPQLYGTSDDVPLIHSIVQLVERRDGVRILSSKWDSEVQQAIVAQMDLVVAGRYHPAIFALKGEVPTVCLAYEHKSVGVMRAVGLERFVIKVEDLSTELLIDRIDAAWDERQQTRDLLGGQVETIRKRALENTMYAIALLDCALQRSIDREEIEREVHRLMTDFEQGKLPVFYDSKRQE